MFITQMSLPRRTFLRGMGAAVALPLLDAMIPALSAVANAAGNPVRRMAFVYIPNGVHLTKWTPASAGTAFELSPTLAPLAPFRSQLVVLSQLSSFPAESQGEGAGDHARASAAWLTGAHPKKSEGVDLRAGKTVDQFAADVLGKETQFPSLQLAVDNLGLIGGCDTGYACTYQNTLSWQTPTTPLPMQNNPRVVFERLFGDASTSEERRTVRQAQRSILDSVTREAVRLQARLGADDRARMNDYLEGIRELERRIQKVEQQADLELSSVPELPSGIPEAFEDHVKLMFDLQVLAYQADLTRVSTFMMSREGANRTYANLGIAEAHHGLSHHGEKADALEKLARIDLYHVQLFAYYLERLRATPAGDGSLLDHSLIMLGSGISDGNIHSHRGLPALVVGGGSGQLKGGRHIVYPQDTPLTNLQLTLLDKVGVHLESFGDSTGRLADL
jgi:hypothetical protein